MKKKTVIIMVSVVCIILLIFGVTAAIKSKNNAVAFQSEDEMTEILNGTWRTGDSEFDFILTIGGGMVNLSMDDKDNTDADNLICVPDK